jgi:histidinol dehydrogenase
MTSSIDSNSMTISRVDARQPGFERALSELRRKLSPSGEIVSERGKQLTLQAFGELLSPSQVVERICNDVKTQGSKALLRYCEVLDNSKLTVDKLRIPVEEMASSHRKASPEFLNAIRRIRKNILEYQTAILHRSVAIQPSDGVTLELRYDPLKRIGVCVPGGAAAYPSTVLMTVVPALAAGVPEIAVVAPPTPFGAFNADVQAVCYELGVTELYSIGGAQAVAALAYGTETIAAVDKIVGPGNMFVALAKRHCYGQVDIDSIAGPSEVVVLVDESTSPAFAAADILAQAEHSPGASILISWSESILEAIEAEVRSQVTQLSRADLTMQALQEFGASILTRDVEQTCQISNLIAPEHLHIQCHQPRQLLDKLKNFGAAFLGPYSPVALGDYAAGPSHVLPTSGTARWASGLNANHFLRSCSVIEYDKAALCEIAPNVELMAKCEGLTAHQNSILLRRS